MEKKDQQGYIAIISVTIFTAVFVILFSGMVASSVAVIRRVESNEGSFWAKAQLNACIERGLNEVRKDPSYSPSEEESKTFFAEGEISLEEQDNYCQIMSIEEVGEETEVTVISSFEEYFKTAVITFVTEEEEGMRSIKIVKREEY